MSETGYAKAEPLNARNGGSVDQAVVAIDAALADLVGAVGELEEQQQALHDRLHPVLRDPSDESGAVLRAESVSPIPSCVLAGALLERAGRIADLASTLRNDARNVRGIRERLEV